MIRKTLLMLAALAMAAPAATQERGGVGAWQEERQQREAEKQEREAEKSQREEEKRQREEERRQREEEKRQRDLEKAEREEERYGEGIEALDERNWEEAAKAFAAVAKMNGRRADAALYWEAYARNKMGRREEALLLLNKLSSTHPKSRWLNDAKALEIEIRQAAGQPVQPEGEEDENLQLIALTHLAHMDPERAIPLLEKVLASSRSPKLKEKALFVLAQSGSPRAREVIGRIARGGANPDLQLKAIRYLGLFGGAESRELLVEIYAASNDVEVKRAILKSFMLGGERGHLLAAARSEANPELRMEAIHQLGLTGAREELWQLYQAESNLEVKEKILHALFLSGHADPLIELARNERERSLRLAAIHKLGLLGSEKTGAALLFLYNENDDAEVRKEVIHSLFLQGNAKGLIEIARKETDPALKKEAVHKLSLMRSKEATDFLMEILNK